MKRVLFLLFSLALVVLPFSARAEVIVSEAVALENIVTPEVSSITSIETISEVVSEIESTTTSPSDLVETVVESEAVAEEDLSLDQVVVEENISVADSASDEGVEENSTTEEILPENSEVFFSSAVSSESSSEVELDSSFNNRHQDEINLYQSCADLNRDNVLNDLDPQVIVDYVFNGGTLLDGVNADTDGNGIITISDAVYLINYLKIGGPAPKCAPIVTSCSDLNRDGILSDLDPMVIVDYIFNGGSIEGINADVDGNGIVTISDAVYLVNYFKAGGPAPKCAPVNQFPVTSCSDLNKDGLVNDLDPQIIVDYVFNGGTISEDVNADADGNGIITISDAVYLINYMKVGGPAPVCKPKPNSCADLNRDNVLNDLDPQVIVDYVFNGGTLLDGVNADTDGNGIITISDAVYLINYLKIGGPAPKCAAGNSLPVFVNFNPPSEIKFGETYSYDVEASDADGDVLSFSLASSSPSGMSIASSTGIISWVPTEAQVSATAYAVTVFVSDGKAEASSSFSILVKAKTETPGGGGGGGGGGGPSVNVPGSYGGGALINYVPASSTSNQGPFFVNFNPAGNATATWLYIYDVEASDPENNPITYSLLEAPFGMNIISQTSFIYWRPSLDQVSATPYRVTIQISDGSNTTSTSYFVRVSNPGPLSFVPLKINIAEAQTENTNQNPESPIQSTSTTTSTPTSTAEVPESGNRNLAAIFFTGLLDFFKNLGLWLWASPCRLVLFVLLLLLLWIVYLKLRSEEEEVKNNDSSGSSQSFRNIEKTSSSTALGNDNNAVMFQEKDLKSGSDSEKVIELTSPLNLDFGKKLQDEERNVD